MRSGYSLFERINCIGAREAGRQYARRCDLQMVYEETFDMEERDKMLSRQTVVVFLYRK